MFEEGKVYLGSQNVCNLYLIQFQIRSNNAKLV